MAPFLSPTASIYVKPDQARVLTIQFKSARLAEPLADSVSQSVSRDLDSIVLVVVHLWLSATSLQSGASVVHQGILDATRDAR